MEDIKATLGIDAVNRGLVHQLGYLTLADFLQIAAVTEGTAETWRKRGEGPAWVRLGNAVFYPIDGVAEFMQQRRKEPRKPVAKACL